MARKNKLRPRTVATLNVAFFGALGLFALVTAVANDDPRGYGFASFGAGCAIMAGAIFTLGPSNAAGKRPMTSRSRILLVIGAAVMAAGPIIMLVAGVDFSERIGTTRRAASIGFMSLLALAMAAAVIFYAVRSELRARAKRRRDTM